MPNVVVFTKPTPQGRNAAEITIKPLTDIIVTKYREEETYNDKDERVIKRIPIKINITKRVNETAKLVKERTAEQKLQELERIFTK